MMENPSKPRKGAPEPAAPPRPPVSPVSGLLSVTEGTPVTRGFFGAGDPPAAGAISATEAAKDASTEQPTVAEARAGAPTSTVVGVVCLVTFFAFVGFFVFRKVREGWYRRHYRKMDFLVDGMYNL
ncbi:uncharacterized protein LOC119108456 [Pollicipes pollicipes]|uniref:uncharacterized protein LOC119108456 n=1 Tax=Pollicipes pollicipes TaxID=41117 RepID=UPI001884EB85|nr:uncharacterized protein LOC119108456 [Pollicipes pollicipes]